MLVCIAIQTPSMASNYAFHFHLALKFRLCTLKILQLLEDSVPGPLQGLRPWTPLLNRWIKHSQQTMNQDNKISSVYALIQKYIELGLYVIILYGPKKRRWYLQTSQYIPEITASLVCTAIKTSSMASNYVFHIHRTLNFRLSLCIF